jgi:hypothetical protein
MLRAIAPLIVPVAMLTVVACGGRDPVDDKAKNTTGLPVINEPAPDATGAPPANAVAAQPLPPSAAKIPQQLQGRWGLTPGDCMSTRGDAKGLLIIAPVDLKFFESRAVPAADAQTSPDSISGNFAFTGEGRTWTKFQALELQGQQLVRTESSPMASFTYARCK